MPETPDPQHDPLDALTIAEIDAGSRLLRADLVGAVTQGTAQRWPALAVVAYLHARRGDPSAQLTQFRAMTPPELLGELGMTTPAPVADDGDGDEEDLPYPDLPEVLPDVAPVLEVPASPVVEEVTKNPTVRPRA